MPNRVNSMVVIVSAPVDNCQYWSLWNGDSECTMLYVQELIIRTIHLMHPEPFFGTFLLQYLRLKGFDVSYSDSNVESFYAINKTKTDLIVMSKESPYLDALGYLIKKRNTDKLSDIPIFMIGDFSPREIQAFKQDKVEAFLSAKINPVALVERIFLFFSLPQPTPEKRTPMLVDMHARNTTLVVQIEGNLETDKLLVLNYRIRLFLRDNKCKVPRILYIIPSLYPDFVNKLNLLMLFGFMQFPELTIEPAKIAVLTRNKVFLEVLSGIQELEHIKRVDNYYEGYQAVTADFDTMNKLPVSFMLAGNKYYLDLFDMKGRIRLRAQQALTQELLDQLKTEGERHLKYYSKQKLELVSSVGDVAVTMDDLLTHEQDALSDQSALLDIVVLDSVDSSFRLEDTSVMDYITKEFSPVSEEIFEETVMNEKQNLFFSSVRGQTLLFISLNKPLFDLVQQALSVYFAIENVHANENIKPILDQNRYGIIFIDLAIPQAIVLKILYVIRSHATRRKTTIILMGKVLSKVELMTYKKYGTDHVILQPFTTEKFFGKVYQAVTQDRGL